MPFVIVTVRPDGTTTVEGERFPDSSCRAATAPYEAALGVVTADAPKPEARIPAQAEARRDIHRTLE